MFVAMVTFAWHTVINRVKGFPLLLLPSGHDFACIVGWGLLLPLAIYGLYTQIPSISGRNFGLAVIWLRFAMEMLVIGVILAIVPLVIAGRAVRRRYRILGISSPGRSEMKSYRIRLLLFWSLLVILVCCALAVGYELLLMQYTGERGYEMLWRQVAPKIAVYNNLHLATLCLFAGVCTAFIVSLLRHVPARPTRVIDCYHRYRATIARSLLPVYALVILFLACLVQPYLLREEARCLQAASVLLPGNGPDINPLDTHVMRELRKEILRIPVPEINKMGK